MVDAALLLPTLFEAVGDLASAEPTRDPATEDLFLVSVEAPSAAVTLDPFLTLPNEEDFGNVDAVPFSLVAAVERFVPPPLGEVWTDVTWDTDQSVGELALYLGAPSPSTGEATSPPLPATVDATRAACSGFVGPDPRRGFCDETLKPRFAAWRDGTPARRSSLIGAKPNEPFSLVNVVPAARPALTISAASFVLFEQARLVLGDVALGTSSEVAWVLTRTCVGSRVLLQFVDVTPFSLPLCEAVSILTLGGRACRRL